MKKIVTDRDGNKGTNSLTPTLTLSQSDLCNQMVYVSLVVSCTVCVNRLQLGRAIKKMPVRN